MCMYVLVCVCVCVVNACLLALSSFQPASHSSSAYFAVDCCVEIEIYCKNLNNNVHFSRAWRVAAALNGIFLICSISTLFQAQPSCLCLLNMRLGLFCFSCSLLAAASVLLPAFLFFFLCFCEQILVFVDCLWQSVAY